MGGVPTTPRMTAVRLGAVLVLALTLAGAAGAAARPVTGKAPQGLRAFLLRADEAPSRTYARTPSFAWKPVPGAVRYEFQLSTANAFREGSIVYSTATLTSPTATVPLTLPWITGSPYSLYARVRAVLPRTATPWSRPFGFNMRWTAVPQPRPGEAGLLRWTAVDGAYAYQVWMVDLPKMVTTYGTVLDQRELYSFHQDAQWTGTIRWRIRAIRWNEGERLNRLPASSYGPWSPIYSTTNPAFAAGPLQPLRTVSDVVSTGSDTSPAHRTMPAFVFAGNRTLSGAAAELFRVYAFTDSDCINPVFTGAIVGSPAYAPRPYGPLALPQTAVALAEARTRYLPDGAEGSTSTLDNAAVRTSESMPQASPTVSLPKEDGASTAAGEHVFLKVDSTLGAPIDLWDTDWPRGAYYWTVVGVEAVSPPAYSTAVAGAVDTGASSLAVGNASGISPGDTLLVGSGSRQETVVVSTVGGNTLGLAAPLTMWHGAGEAVVRSSTNLQYRDMELAQEVCASGRVLRFGKTSEPIVTGAGAPFASGLSVGGRLTTATRASSTFYGHPLVAWSPALGAAVYQVQWSKTRYPFRPELDPRTGTRGLLTLSTSAILPLRPGTWWYRVRGVNFQLPSGAQQMSWSPAARLVVARPKFRVVR